MAAVSDFHSYRHANDENHHNKESTTPAVIFIGFNQDASCLGVGTHCGFLIFSVSPFCCISRVDCGAISMIEMLYRTSLVATVGSSEGNTTSARLIMLWDVDTKKCLTTLTFPSSVHAVKMNTHRLIAVLNEEIRIYDLHTLNLLNLISTPSNGNVTPRICCLSASTDKGYMVIPCASEIGMLNIIDAYTLKSAGNLAAHRNLIQALAFNSTGTLLATASTKGTIVRIWTVPGLDMLWSCRRGSKDCLIHHLNFSEASKYLTVTGSSGKIHIFKLCNNDNDLKGVSDAFTTHNSLPHSEALGGGSAADYVLTDVIHSKYLPEISSSGSLTDNTFLDLEPYRNDVPSNEIRSNTPPPSQSLGYVKSIYKNALGRITSYLPPLYREALQACRCFSWINLHSKYGSKFNISVVLNPQAFDKCEVFVASTNGCAHLYEFSQSTGGECRLRDECIFMGMNKTPPPPSLFYN